MHVNHLFPHNCPYHNLGNQISVHLHMFKWTNWEARSMCACLSEGPWPSPVLLNLRLTEDFEMVTKEQVKCNMWKLGIYLRQMLFSNVSCLFVGTFWGYGHLWNFECSPTMDAIGGKAKPKKAPFRGQVKWKSFLKLPGKKELLKGKWSQQMLTSPPHPPVDNLFIWMREANNKPYLIALAMKH